MDKMKRMWKTQDGRELLVEEMETGHIKNSINYLERNGFVSYKEFIVWFNSYPPDEDFTDRYSEISIWKISLSLDWLREELYKREQEEKARQAKIDFLLAHCPALKGKACPCTSKKRSRRRR